MDADENRVPDERERLILQIARLGRYLIGVVEHQDESLRNKGELWPLAGEAWEPGNVLIWSGNHPELKKATLFVRGAARDLDDTVFVERYPTTADAVAALQAIRTAVRRFNRMGTGKPETALDPIVFERIA